MPQIYRTVQNASIGNKRVLVNQELLATEHTMEATNVRVDAELLEQHRGELVRIIGKCELSDPSANTATLICNGNIKLSTGDDHLTVGKIYEVIGKANATTLDVNVYSVTELSDNTNIENALKLAHFIHKVPELYIQ